MRDLLELVARSTVPPNEPIIWSARRAVTRDQLGTLGRRLSSDLHGRSVAVRIFDPVDFIEALFALDGRAASILILAADLPNAQTTEIMALGGADVLIEQLTPFIIDPRLADTSKVRTRWHLTTSGTTGTPKLVDHGFDNLARSVKPPRSGAHPIWGLLYDPSRFAGLQVILQALAGGGKLIVTDPHEDLGARVAFLAEQGCTHLSATPSMWRKILMDPASDSLALAQATLGGEIADDRVLSALGRRFPDARISHIYASTELGVGFAINDRRAGFPREMLEQTPPSLAMKIVDDLLWIRPPEMAARPRAAHIQVDDQGFFCTGDRIKLTEDRVLFSGREAALVNVGGVKLQLEHLESKLRENPSVRDGVFAPISNPILGSVLSLTVAPAVEVEDERLFKKALKAWCREHMQPEAVPAKIEIASEIALASSGKVRRKTV